MRDDLVAVAVIVTGTVGVAMEMASGISFVVTPRIYVWARPYGVSGASLVSWRGLPSGLARRWSRNYGRRRL
jgi:hypothetical protein